VVLKSGIEQVIFDSCPLHKSNPDVVMMESSKQWDGLNAADRLRGAADRCILAEREEGPDLIVIVSIGLQHLPEMPFAKDHDMIETFPPDRADDDQPPLGGPGRMLVH
jgi:hypothetical protein